MIIKYQFLFVNIRIINIINNKTYNIKYMRKKTTNIITSATSPTLKIYSINLYSIANAKFIKNNAIETNNINEITTHLSNDNGFHFRIHKKSQYIFFGDLDNYENSINSFIIILQEFMKEKYDLKFSKEDFKYTQNNEKNNSYHYSIPKWNASTEKLKEIHTNLLSCYADKFINKQKTSKCVDTTIYSEHWYRCPNQKKGNSNTDTSKHIIKNGIMKDFVIEFIPEQSININEKIFIENQIEQSKILVRKKKSQIVIEEIDNNNDEQTQSLIIDTVKNTELIQCDTEKIKKENVLSTMMSKPVLYKKLFDECYKQERFNAYESWIAVGMALKNTKFENDETSFELFNYFSSKGHNYDGIAETKQKYNTFIQTHKEKSYTIATVYYFAKEDNKPQFLKILNNNSFDLEQYDMCNYVKTIAGHRFKYAIINGRHILYCFDGKLWQKTDILLKNFLSYELYEFLKMILFELYFEHKSFNQMTTQIKRLKTASFKRDVVETYKELGTDKQLKLDSNPYLLGFNNLVYDLELGDFREYKYEDYISFTTGYDWREPTQKEIETITKIIAQIMPHEDERELYLQILSTSLSGICIERFVIFNGGGGNGKGMLNDLLLLSLGKDYSMIGNNALLFEVNKTGSNPEKANMDKKRLIIFREPPEKQKFCNSTIKEISGGGVISARGHHESETQKELQHTMIVECNRKPIFKEEPTQAEVRRIIDIYFRSTFTMDEKLVEPEKHIYLANPLYKETEFQQTHKFALMKILMDAYKRYKLNNKKLIIPKSIEERTQTYLELSCNLVTWFKDNYEFTNNKNDICKIKDLYTDLTTSVYFLNLTKAEKQKYNKAYFTEYVQTNIFFVRYYKARCEKFNNFLTQWKKKNFNTNYDD
jgi:phage/plasmid-associated DNA primase